MEQTIFDILYEKYTINKPIRLIEMFSGYGSQALALKYLGVPFEHWKICEWAVKSIQAYKDIHFTDVDINYSSGFYKQKLQEMLLELGISSNYNEPMTKEQINRLSEEQLRTIWNNIVTTHNLVNIQQVKGKDLEIVDTDKYDYILTYSFPCQDLSLAGKGKGMSDTSTRSGMLWEVERILTECHKLGTMPQVLLMENVPQVHSQDNMPDFHKWQVRLEELGYHSYWQDLIATDYGIPQTRNRCFMVSILGNYSYTFPKSIPLKLKLKDMLEDNVDEKYYLSDNQNLSLQQTLEKNKLNNTCYIDTYNKRIDEEKSGTITTGVSFRNNTFLAIKNATKQGYLEATDGDGVDLTQPNSKTRRGRVQKQAIQTLTTQNNLGVVVNMKNELCNNLIKNGKIKENDVIRHSYTTSRNENWNKRNIEQNNLSPTLDTRCDCLGVCVGTYQYAKSDKFMNGKDRLQLGKETSDTLQTTQKEAIVNSDLRIRKLTPKECGRLMNVKNEDIDKMLKNQSDASAYHLFGDSICTNCLMAIFGELCNIDWKQKLYEMLGI